MSYTLKIARSAEKELDRLPRAARESVADRILSLENTPRPIGVKKLQGRESSYRLRVGDYRVLYTISDQDRVMTIYAVGHRREVYR